MIRKYLIAVLTLSFIAAVQVQAYAKPNNLVAEPVSGTQIDLTWEIESGDTTFDVWMTKNGNTWNKVNNSPLNTTSYSVYNGIDPWINYYFLVSKSGFVQNNNPLTTADFVYNATDIIPVFPPGQTAHGSYKNNTNLCAKCHRTHTAAGPKLLKYATVNDTCITCHDGSGSKYNVFTGTIDAGDTTLNSNSGPFGNMFNHVKDGNDQAVDIPMKSRHSVDLNVSLSTAPGANTSEGNGWDKPFSCGSCHDAHGSHNYRMLTESLPGSPEIDVLAFAETDKVNHRENIYYRSGMNTFCKGCHQKYFTERPGAGSETVAGSAYMHPVGIAPSSYAGGPLTTSLPLEGSDLNHNNNKMICATCHNAHGSNSQTTESRPGETDGNNDAVNYLLRLDYRGVCQDCHKK